MMVSKNMGNSIWEQLGVVYNMLRWKQSTLMQTLVCGAAVSDSQP